MKAPATTRHHAALAAAVAAAIALTAAPFAEAASTPNEARVSQVVRSVSLLRPQTKATPAAIGDEVAGQTSVRTGVKSRAELKFQDATLLRLGSNTLFSFTGGKKKDFDLTQGTALLQTNKKTGGARVRSGSITAAITGSAAIVSAPEPGKAGVFKFMLIYGESHGEVCGKKIPLQPWQMLIVPLDKNGDPICDKISVVWVDISKAVATSNLVQGFPTPLNLAELEKNVREAYERHLKDGSFQPVNSQLDSTTREPKPQEENALGREMPEMEASRPGVLRSCLDFLFDPFSKERPQGKGFETYPVYTSDAVPGSNCSLPTCTELGAALDKIYGSPKTGDSIYYDRPYPLPGVNCIYDSHSGSNGASP